MSALPDIPDAKLPMNYEAARQAIQTCAQVDECQDWADRAAALASYARQADDDLLLRQCQRIRARAVYARRVAQRDRAQQRRQTKN